MTSIRQGFIVGLESSYGMGKDGSYKWFAPPPGSFISTQHNRQAARVQSTGTKFWDTVAYGRLTGSFSWKFTIDYRYLEPFFLIFEEYIDPTQASGTGAVGSRYEHTNGYYTFAKQDGKRVKSFTIRRKILNHVTNGIDETDEMTELRGCVIRNFRVSKASATSQINVELTGFYANEIMVEGYLPTTDYKAYDGKLAEYMCMFTTDNDTDYEYVANTDSLSLGVSNNADAIYTTCSPFAKNFYEGTASFEFSTSCWSNDIHRYKTRVYNGGKQYVHAAGEAQNTYVPRTKGLTPLPGIKLYTYSGYVDPTETNLDIQNVIDSSEDVMVFNIRDTVIKSLPWPNGDGSKIQDTISSAECRNIWLEVKKNAEDNSEYNPANTSGTRNMVNSLDINSYAVSIYAGNHGHLSINASSFDAYSFYLPVGATYSLSGGDLVFSNGTTISAVGDTNYTLDKWQYESVTNVSTTDGALPTTTSEYVDIASGTTYTVRQAVTIRAVFKST